MILKKIFLLLVVFSCPALAMHVHAAAMGMGMGMGPPCGPPFPPCPIPLDSGIMLLLAAGAAYGCWKVYTSLKNPA